MQNRRAGSFECIFITQKTGGPMACCTPPMRNVRYLTVKKHFAHKKHMKNKSKWPSKILRKNISQKRCHPYCVLPRKIGIPRKNAVKIIEQGVLNAFYCAKSKCPNGLLHTSNAKRPFF